MTHRIYTGSFAALEERRIAGRRPVANLRFFTFLDLVAKLERAAGSVARKPRLPRLGASVLLEEILETDAPEAFAAVSRFAGFRGALLDTFRDLRDAGIAPDKFERSLLEFRGVTSDRVEHLPILDRAPSEGY